jgi:hypothetical protein
MLDAEQRPVDAGGIARRDAGASQATIDVAAADAALDAPASAGARPPLPAWMPKSDRDCPPVTPCPAGMSRIPGGTNELGWYVCSFCFDLTEVTVEAYAACASAKRCSEPESYALLPREDEHWYRYACNWKHPEGRHDHPVNCVTIADARAYCAWRGHGRLPTGSELQWASAGGEEARPFPWGSDPLDGTRLNACGTECPDDYPRHGEHPDVKWSSFPWRDPYPETAPVGSFPAGRGRWGQLDLAGNVSEYANDGLPGLCMGDFSPDGLLEGAYRSGSCQKSALPGVSGASTGGFRCASGGRPIRRDIATCNPYETDLPPNGAKGGSLAMGLDWTP